MSQNNLIHIEISKGEKQQNGWCQDL